MVFLAFLLLLLLSIGATLQGLEAQKQDARIIGLAGRQRMLLQQMTRLALGFERQDKADSAALLDAAISFENALDALRSGGPLMGRSGEVYRLPPAKSAGLRAELDALQAAWRVYRAKIDLLLRSEDAASTRGLVAEIEGLSPAVIEQAERVTAAFEAASTAQTARLRAYQLIFLLGGLALLSAGWWITRRSVVRPLSQLKTSARRIGEGDLASPIRLDGPVEVQVFSQALETMRTQLLASQQALQQGAALLEERVHRRTRELEALAEVTQEINLHLSIAGVLSLVTEKARQLLASEVASLCLLDPDRKVLSLHALSGPESAVLQSQSPADGPAARQVLRETCAHPCGLQSCTGFCRIIAPAYRTSHMAAPLRSGDKVIGALCVGSSRPDAFRPDALSALYRLASAAAIALENSRLYQQAEHAAALEERQRIASEMHDGLLQTLSFLGMMVRLMRGQLAQGNPEKALAALQQIERAEEQAESEIRRAIASLQDSLPLNDTLQDCLSALSTELSQAAPPVHFETDLLIPVVLPRQESEQVLRVAREALLNAQRYSRSEKVFLTLEKAGNEMVMTVKDHGVGFTPGSPPQDGRSHFGMKIMQARAARLGGQLLVRSTPGAGAEVQLRWAPASPQNGG